MCGRFALKNPSKELQAYYQTTNTVEYAARYNIAPSQPVVTVHSRPQGQRLMDLMQWGLVPSWSKDPKIGNRMINARSETVEEKPSYRTSFKRKRCIIPANGFYEWHIQTREPYYFSPKAVVNGEFTVKRIKKENGRVWLMPENDQYQPMEMKEGSELEVWGVVTNVIHKLA